MKLKAGAAVTMTAELHLLVSQQISQEVSMMSVFPVVSSEHLLMSSLCVHSVTVEQPRLISGEEREF